MRTIWKYPITEMVMVLDVPSPAIALTVQVQQQASPTICVWAVVDPDQPTKKVKVYVVGTGHPIPNDVRQKEDYVGTIQSEAGFVWHIYWAVQGG